MGEFVEVTLPDGRKIKVNKKNLENYQAEVVSSRKPTELPEFTITAIKSKKPTLYDKSKEEQNHQRNDFLGYLDYKNSEHQANFASTINKMYENADRLNKEAEAKEQSELSDLNFIHKVNLAASDAQVRNTAFTDDKTLDFWLNAGTPSQLFGAVIDGFQGGSYEDFVNSLKNGNSGFVSDNFYKEHPYWSNVINFVGDGVAFGSPKLIPRGANYAYTKLVPKDWQLAREMNKNLLKPIITNKEILKIQSTPLINYEYAPELRYNKLRQPYLSDIRYSFLDDGSEAIVFNDRLNPDRITKVLTDSPEIKTFITNRNNVPYQLPLRFEGYTSNKYPLVSQEKVFPMNELEFNKAIPEIKKMLQKDFIGDVGNEYLSNGKLKIGDFQPGNVAYDKNGNIVFIDIDAYPIDQSSVTDKYKSLIPKNLPKTNVIKSQFKDTNGFRNFLQKIGVDVSQFSDDELEYLMTLRQNSITHPTERHALLTEYKGQPYVDLFDGKNNTGYIDFKTLNSKTNSYHIGQVEKLNPDVKGVSEHLYNVGIDYSNRNLHNGIVSGEVLISPEFTYKVWDKFPKHTVISNDGHHTFNFGRDVQKSGKSYEIINGQVRQIHSPSFTPKYKHTQFFLPEAIKSGKIVTDWNKLNPYLSLIPLIYGFSTNTNSNALSK